MLVYRCGRPTEDPTMSDSAWTIIQRVRREMRESGAPEHLVGEATDAMLLAGHEGTQAVAERWLQLKELL